MNVDLSPQDLAFQEEVRDFLATNAHDPKTDYGQWRLNWFELAKAKGGWDVPKWPTAFGGPGWTFGYVSASISASLGLSANYLVA